jgi:hypothetical protein
MMMMRNNKRVFPIRTDTACQLKWSWTALFLEGGYARTCHRTAETDLTPDNFADFHNTDIVLSDRKRMLQGVWPESSCNYCKDIEQAGGISDRLRQIDIPDLYPEELDADPQAIMVQPTVVEVFFKNTCNLGCLYCTPELSSRINAEYAKFGLFKKNGVMLKHYDVQSNDLLPSFWSWFPKGFPKLKRFHILGGEPLYLKEIPRLLDMIDRSPNPNCELNIITNLSADIERVTTLVQSLKRLWQTGKVGRIDMTISLDCWGIEQEYVRHGLNLAQWEKNFDYLLSNPWLYLSINNTISVLTIKTLPELIERMNAWSEKLKVHHHFSVVSPGPSYLHPNILGPDEFAEDFQMIISVMPIATDEDRLAVEYMRGIANHYSKTAVDTTEITKMFTFLDEQDRRRGSSWQQTFPWLEKYKKYVVQ